MSLHKSLRTKGKLVRMRNVLNRTERIEELERSGRWNPELNSPYGLPKVRVLKIKKRAKEAKKKDEEGAAAPGAEAAAPSGAPAGKAAAKAGAAPAKGGAGKG